VRRLSAFRADVEPFRGSPKAARSKKRLSYKFFIVFRDG